MKKILVTGGAGFIGSHTCLKLLENNFKVFIIDSFTNSSSIALKKLKFILKEQIFNIDNNLKIFKVDIRDSKCLFNTFKTIKDEENIDAVIHFAGLKAVSESVSNPLSYWESNVNGSINLLKIMDEFNCHNLIFSSSATIYSKNNKLPLKETSELGAVNPYGNTKLTIERILEDLYKSAPKSWRICNLRYFNPIGAHPSGLIGEDPKGTPNNIFPLILNAAYDEINTLKIFGNDWDTPDGTCIRDYIHVMDLADGHMTSLNYLLDNSAQFLNINLGTGIGTTVLELIKTFEDVNNVNIPLAISNRRPGDLPKIIADNNKALKLLNWLPKRNISDMCRDGWKWKCMNPDGYANHSM